MERLSGWCRDNNQVLNTTKTEELITDYRRNKMDIEPLYISGDCVERVSTFRLLGVQIEVDLTWSANSKELIKKAQQRLYFLRLLRKNNLSQKLLVAFYHCSILCAHILCVCGTLAVQRQKRRRSRGSSPPLRKLLAALSPPWKNTSSPVVSKRQKISSETNHIQDTVCLSCCPLAGDTG